MRGFLLGLSNGTTCLAFCAPVLVPFLMHEGEGIRRSLAMLLMFLGGRLAGYMLFGVLAWAAGNLLLHATGYQGLLVGVAYVGLAALLLLGVLRRPSPRPDACALKGTPGVLGRWPTVVPMSMGFLAGFKICPPVLLAFTDAALAGSLLGSLLFFLAFFLGTSIYFVPLSLVGALKRVADLRIVGRFAAVIVALYYLLAGILLCAGGVR